MKPVWPKQCGPWRGFGFRLRVLKISYKLHEFHENLIWKLQIH